MNTLNNENKISNKQVENSQVNTTAKTPSAKDKVMKDGKLTFWEILYVVRYFLPILTSVGWIIGLGFMPEDGTFLMAFSLILVTVGLISAITVSPLKFIKFIFNSTISGFRFLRSFIPFYGVADLIAAIFGTALGFMFGVFVVFGVPAVFTITKFFNEDSFN